MTESADLYAALPARVNALRPELTEVLADLVRIPSISNAEFDQAAVQASAQRVKDLLVQAGATSADIYRVDTPAGTPGAPAVIARFDRGADLPTVMLYAHHDVQPIPDPSAWDTEPFEPVIANGRMWGRGAADDKAGVVLHVGALRALGEDLGVNVVVFVEGEEEVGSPSFAAFLRTHRQALAADVIVVADSGNWDVGRPALTTSLRGLVDCFVDLRILEHAVHSGMYGGVVLDAHVLMAKLVATLHDDQGEVAVAGLVVAPEPDIDYSSQEMRQMSGLVAGADFAGSGTFTGRMWSKPAISIIGWDAVSAKAASNTMTPATTVRLSMRIPAGQDPQAAFQALEEHLLAQAPLGAQVRVRPTEFGKPFATGSTAAAMGVAHWAFAQAWGVPGVNMGVGGSIPFISELLEVFPQATILVTGVEDPDSRAHGANESLHLDDWEKAIVAEALLLARLGEPTAGNAI